MNTHNIELPREIIIGNNIFPQIIPTLQKMNLKGPILLLSGPTTFQVAGQAVSIANKTYILEDGKNALKGGKEILKNKRIKHIYFGGR